MAIEIFSGARAKFFLNNRAIGFCAGVSGEEAVDYSPVDTLDFLEVREHVPVAYRTSLSAAFFRLIGSPLKDYTGKFDTDPESISIFPKFDDILTNGAMSASIQLGPGKGVSQYPQGTIMAKFDKVRAASKTFDVSARGVVTENCSFVAVRQMDESTV